MKNVLRVLAVLFFSLLSFACLKAEIQTDVPPIAIEKSFHTGIASEDARITRSKDRLVACAFFLEIPEYGLIKFEATSENPGVFGEDGREACSLIRKGDRIQVAITTQYSDGIKMTPDRWVFEAKAIYGRMIS